MKYTGLGSRLRYGRQLLGVSASELDNISGLTRNHVSKIESGKIKDVTTAVAERLATVLGVSLDWLISGRGEAPKPKEEKGAA